MKRLLDAVAPRPDDVFLEIGPGRGALSLPLAACVRRVAAVEIDRTLAARLRSRAPSNLEVVDGDALEIDFASLVPPGSRLVGNLPYYVSSPLLRRILEGHARFRDAHVMLQREVAERVAARPGGKEYGILSVLYALWAKVEIPLRFPPGAFEPPPKVGSALLRATFLDRPRAEVTDPRAFETLVQRAFSRRRRTLENNLRDSYPNLNHHLRLLNLAGSRRAETLSVAEFAELSRALS